MTKLFYIKLDTIFLIVLHLKLQKVKIVFESTSLNSRVKSNVVSLSRKILNFWKNRYFGNNFFLLSSYFDCQKFQYIHFDNIFHYCSLSLILKVLCSNKDAIQNNFTYKQARFRENKSIINASMKKYNLQLSHKLYCSTWVFLYIFYYIITYVLYYLDTYI